MAMVKELSGNGGIMQANTAGVPDKHLSRVVSIKRSYAVTLSDTVDLPQGTTEGLLVGTAGNVKVTYSNGVVDTVYCGAGTWLPMNVTRVWSTGTTALNINAGY